MNKINVIGMDEARIDHNNDGSVDEIENDPDFSLSPNYNDECKNDYYVAGVEVVNQMKEKFAESTDLSEKILLLTLLPRS